MCRDEVRSTHFSSRLQVRSFVAVCGGRPHFTGSASVTSQAVAVFPAQNPRAQTSIGEPRTSMFEPLSRPKTKEPRNYLHLWRSDVNF